MDEENYNPSAQYMPSSVEAEKVMSTDINDSNDQRQYRFQDEDSHDDN